MKLGYLSRMFASTIAKGDSSRLAVVPRLLLLAAFSSLALSVGAETTVSGAIVADTTWTAAQSPYLVNADLTISQGAVLTVEPGVMVRMTAGANLIVNQGALKASGSAVQPIIVTSGKDIPNGGAAPGDWGQLVFLDATSDAQTVLDWIEVRYGGGIRVERASPTLNNVGLYNNNGAAITIDLESSPMGSGLKASGNTLNGISVPAGEIVNNVQWRLQGIPYVVAQGVVSVGRKPVITGITPNTIQQGQSIDALISGTRLGSAEFVIFDSSGLTSTVSPGGTDTSLPVRITATAAQELGLVGFEAQTAAGRARFDLGLEVRTPLPTLAVDGVTPTNLRRQQTQSFQLSGNHLLGAQVSVPAGAGLTLSKLQTTTTTASFDLAASSTAALGAQALMVTNPTVANGSSSATVLVTRALPTAYASPSPLAVPPDGGVHSFSVRLSDIDDAPHTLDLSVLDSSLATISPATLTIAAGSIQATASVTGLRLGYTVLTISSPTLGVISVPIYITNALNGAAIGPIVSSVVGVSRLMGGAALPVGTAIGPIVSPVVGVNRPTTGAALPAGTAIGPIVSSIVGVSRPTSGTALPVGASIGPIVSSAVGVNRPTSGAALPAGASIGPIVSPVIGVQRP